MKDDITKSRVSLRERAQNARVCWRKILPREAMAKERLFSLKVMHIDLRKCGLHSCHKCLGPNLVTEMSKAGFFLQVTVLWRKYVREHTRVLQGGMHVNIQEYCRGACM